MATFIMTKRLNAERLFFTGISIAMVVVVFIGFSPTYFLLKYLHGTTSFGSKDGANLTPLVHVHAVVFSAWMLLFVTQVSLIAKHRIDLHRIFGLVSTLVAVAIVVVGTETAIMAGRLGHHPPGWSSRAFLLIPLSNIILFSGFVIAGFANRRQGDNHKRLMLIATFGLLIPPGARIARMLHHTLNFLPAGPIGGMIIADIFLMTLVSFDVANRGRLHPATLWGGGLFLVLQPLHIMFASTPLWQGFAQTLIG